MLVEVFSYIIVICIFFAFVLWFAEETKIGRKFSNWLLNKILGTHFENLD